MSSFGHNPNRDKFYKGPSADSAWNHDLLWKARVTGENTLIGIKQHENVPSHYTTTVGPSGTIDAQRVRERTHCRRIDRAINQPACLLLLRTALCRCCLPSQHRLFLRLVFIDVRRIWVISRAHHSLHR